MRKAEGEEMFLGWLVVQFQEYLIRIIRDLDAPFVNQRGRNNCIIGVPESIISNEEMKLVLDDRPSQKSTKVIVLKFRSFVLTLVRVLRNCRG